MTVAEALITLSGWQNHGKSLIHPSYMHKMSLNVHSNTLLPLPKDQVSLQEITLLTVVAVVVHQDDFFEQVCRSVIDSRVD